MGIRERFEGWLSRSARRCEPPDLGLTFLEDMTGFVWNCPDCGKRVVWFRPCNCDADIEVRPEYVRVPLGGWRKRPTFAVFAGCRQCGGIQASFCGVCIPGEEKEKIDLKALLESVGLDPYWLR